MKALRGALPLLLVLALASCTSFGEARWAAHEAPGPGAVDTVTKTQGTAATVPTLGDVPALGFLYDGGRAKSEEGVPYSRSPVFVDSDHDGLPDNRLPELATKSRKMVYSASLQVRVASVEDAVRRLLDRVGQLEGYLAQRNDNVLTCRIPAKSFPTLVQEVKGYGTVLQESMRAQDVTKQHVDMTIRLENAETARKRLLSLLEKATKVEDILKIEEQLTRLTETIERIKGELKYLNEQIAYSLVSVGFQSASPSTTPPTRRSRSRFDWINQVGIEQVLRRF